MECKDISKMNARQLQSYCNELKKRYKENNEIKFYLPKKSYY